MMLDHQRLRSRGLEAYERRENTQADEHTYLDEGTAHLSRSFLLLVCDALTLKEVARVRPKGRKPPKGPRRDIFGRPPATLHSALFPSPSRLAVGCCDGTVRFWDTRTWKEQASLYPAIGPLCDLGFSPAANVAMAMAGVKVAVWEKGEWGD